MTYYQINAPPGGWDQEPTDERRLLSQFLQEEVTHHQRHSKQGTLAWLGSLFGLIGRRERQWHERILAQYQWLALHHHNNAISAPVVVPDGVDRREQHFWSAYLALNTCARQCMTGGDERECHRCEKLLETTEAYRTVKQDRDRQEM